MKYKFTLYTIFTFFVLSGVSLPFFALAANTGSKILIENLTVDQKNDFVLEPGKAEIFINPGETVTRSIYVTNRVPGKTSFKVQIEDIKGTRDEGQTVVVLDGIKGEYSGKDFIFPETDNMTLSFGQRITIPLTITVPKGTPPGDYDASVLVSNQPTVDSAANNGSTNSATRVISRIGTLLFIRVIGQAKESAVLDDLKIKGPKKLFYNSGPLTFQILFNNSGNTHLVPYGTIGIKNMFGQMVDELPVDAYYSLPDSLRYRDVTWSRQALFGRYTATVNLNRGYADIWDTKTIAFWVIPWKILVTAFVGVFVVVLLVVTFLRTFEFKRKNRDKI